MNLDNVKLILGREIRDQLRDRRTLFMIFVLPILLYPLLGMSLFQMSQFRREQPTNVLVLGSPELSSPPYLINGHRFERRLFSDSEREREADLLVLDFAPQGPKQRAEACRAVDAGEYDAALYFPPDFARRLDRFAGSSRSRCRRGNRRRRTRQPRRRRRRSPIRRSSTPRPTIARRSPAITSGKC